MTFARAHRDEWGSRRIVTQGFHDFDVFEARRDGGTRTGDERGTRANDDYMRSRGSIMSRRRPLSMTCLKHLHAWMRACMDAVSFQPASSWL